MKTQAMIASLLLIAIAVAAVPSASATSIPVRTAEAEIYLHAAGCDAAVRFDLSQVQAGVWLFPYFLLVFHDGTSAAVRCW